MDHDFLMEEFEKVTTELGKKLKDPTLAQRATYPISYPTTFLPLDFANGIRSEVTELNKDITYIYDSIGIGEGSINMFVGKTGSGKTTICEQIAASIAGRFKYSHILHDDLENGASLSRIGILTGWDSRRLYKNYILKQGGITSNVFYNRIKAYCDLKLRLVIEHPEAYTYFTGTFDVTGKPVFKPIPTVWIMDSLALLAPGEMSEEEKVTGNMTGSQTAKANAQIFKRLAQPIKSANIILLIVNHLNSNIKINMFDNKGSQINYLGQDEVIPGLVTLPVSF